MHAFPVSLQTLAALTRVNAQPIGNTVPGSGRLIIPTLSLHKLLLRSPTQLQGSSTAFTLPVKSSAQNIKNCFYEYSLIIVRIKIWEEEVNIDYQAAFWQETSNN